MKTPAPHEKVALQAEGVTFSYGNRPVLQDVSIEVPAGSFCVLLGVNGAGKTTLFSLLTRLFLCRRGRIRILGRDLHADGHRALAGLGVVFQQPTLDLDLTLRQNLRYFCVLQGLDPVLARERIQQALTDIGLSDRGDDKVRQLSGGQRRRLELARALLHRPRLLLADEATVGLDIHSRQAILQQVRAECRERGVGVLWATHLVDEVRGDDRVVVLHRGSVLQQGSAEVLLRETASDTVEQAFNRLTRGDAA
ncbi:MAG: ATP-binding cassette domain-containing protein [Chromatiaceae bacterium]|nr:ATP-binding cassette domain-containing protein [Chromatiaceae bacterium]MCP5314209.1 ATP-binding cassette domain-containing protein [Chromatiaceae bacterium]